MLGWFIIFVMAAVFAAIVGFTGVVAAAATFAKVVFWILLVLFLVVLIMSLVGQSDTRTVP